MTSLHFLYLNERSCNESVDIVMLKLVKVANLFNACHPMKEMVMIHSQPDLTSPYLFSISRCTYLETAESEDLTMASHI